MKNVYNGPFNVFQQLRILNVKIRIVTIMVRTILLILLVYLTTASFDPFLPHSLSRQNRGVGLTDSQADFIKARIIEYQKYFPNIFRQADNLQPIFNSLGGVWGVFIIEDARTLNEHMAFRVGDPYLDKWIEIDNIGINTWDYSIWRQR